MAKPHDDALLALIEDVHGSPQGRRERALDRAVEGLEGQGRAAGRAMGRLQAQGTPRPQDVESAESRAPSAALPQVELREPIKIVSGWGRDYTPTARKPPA